MNRKEQYRALLQNPKWFSKRKEIIERDGHKCRNCSSEKNLVVHHRQYHWLSEQDDIRTPWDYPNDLLITLCSSCHDVGHEIYDIPSFTI